MAELDPRIIQIGIEVNGRLKTYEGLNLRAVGTKYANANQNECEVTITNLDKETQDYILTETSPFNRNRTPKSVIVRAGRVSYGTTQIYRGNIASAHPTQPPDVSVVLKCMTGNFFKGNIISRSSPGTVNLSQLAKQIAADNNLALHFQAQEKSIANYQFTGGSLNQVDKLSALGGLNVYVDDGTLVVKTINEPLNRTFRVLSAETGMVGIPEITEQGVKVKYLLDNTTKLGGGMVINSKIYPAVNGNYVIFKLGFEIASRDTPFYYIAEGKRL
jgi:hypothetical protein